MSEVRAFPMFIEHPGDIADHPMVLTLGDGERMGALGLYGTVGSWAARYAPDGTVPSSVATMHDGRGKLASALVACGLWAYDDAGERATYRFVHWPKPSAEWDGSGG